MHSEVGVYNGGRSTSRYSVLPDNMNTKVLIFLGLVALAAADRRPTSAYGAPQRSSEESYESGEDRYNFNFVVSDDSSSNEFGHQEAGDGDNTQGSYFVQLPDGRRQTVTFTVNSDEGYVADVTYSGEAQFPDSSDSYESRESPRYAAPKRSYFAPDSNESK